MRVEFDYYEMHMVAEGEISKGEPPSAFSPGQGPHWLEDPIISLGPVYEDRSINRILDKPTFELLKERALRAFLVKVMREEA